MKTQRPDLAKDRGAAADPAKVVIDCNASARRSPFRTDEEFDDYFGANLGRDRAPIGVYPTGQDIPEHDLDTTRRLIAGRAS